MKRIVLLFYFLCGVVYSAEDLEIKPAHWKIAMTFDDVLMANQPSCTLGKRKQVQRDIIKVLNLHKVNALALMVTDGQCAFSTRGLANDSARMWLNNGHQIGQQSATFIDINKVSAETYLSDLGRAHQTLVSVFDEHHTNILWFRAPYLHRGNKPEKKQAIEDWLYKYHYREAPVTIDSKEAVYARAYERALRDNHTEMANLIVQAYLAHLKTSANFYRNLSQQVFHRDIVQVLRLRVNQLNADHLEQVFSMFQNDLSVQWVDIESALSDSAYESKDDYVGNPGLSWIFRWGHTQYLDVDIDFIPQADEWIAAFASGASLDEVIALRQPPLQLNN